MFWNDPTLTLDTPGGTITFNAATGDAYLNDPTNCTGLDQGPLRVNTEQRPQTDGGIGHPAFRDIRHVVINGLLQIRSAGDDAGYVNARSALEDAMTAALESIENADGTLSWAGGTKSLTVRCDVGVSYPGGNEKTYVFGLYALNPTIG